MNEKQKLALEIKEKIIFLEQAINNKKIELENLNKQLEELNK